MTLRPRSVTNPTARPSPVQRVPNGRDELGGSVTSGRGLEPSKLAAQRMNAPAGFCRQYASRPVGESSGAARVAAGAAPPAPSPDDAVVTTRAIEAPAITTAATRYGRIGRKGRTSSIIASCRIL